MERSDATGGAGGRRGLCVLLHRPGESTSASPPRELMATLARKGLEVSVCHSIYDSMAELVLHERRITRGETRKPVVLMLVEPSSIPGGAELVKSAERYARHSTSWRYSRNERPRLAAYKAEASGADEPEESDERKQPAELGRIAGALSVLRGRAAARASEGAAFADDGPAKPRLRLAGDPGEGASASHVDSPTAQRRADDPGLDIHVGEPRPLTASPEQARPARARTPVEEPSLPGESLSDASSVGPLLSEEELAILLWDTWYPESAEE